MPDRPFGFFRMRDSGKRAKAARPSGYSNLRKTDMTHPFSEKKTVRPGNKPSWLARPLSVNPKTAEIASMLRKYGLHTVCQSARCPNKFECFGCGTATFMILGEICTRHCSFCAVKKGKPSPPDPGEPEHVAEAAAAFGLEHAVVTSVTRDDLADGGLGHFASTVEALRRKVPGASVEILTPDFAGLPERDRRAVSIEVGIQNSALGLILIFNFFDGLGGMAIVTAWWGIWHIISGLTVSTIWSKKDPQGVA